MQTSGKTEPLSATAAPAAAGEIAVVLATALIALLSLTMIFFMLASLVGLHASPLYPCIAAAVAMAGLMWRVRATTGSTGTTVAAALAFLVLVSGSIAFQSYVMDDTWDSFAYHEPYAMLIAHGTNPVYDWHKFEDLCCPDPPWLMTKGFESDSGCFLSLFHAIETCKVIHLLPLFAALLLAWSFFYNLLEGHKGKEGWSVALAVLSTLGPTVLTELSTFLLDVDVSNVFNCVLFSLGLIVLNRRNKTALTAFALSLIYFLNLKLSCVIYAVILIFAAGAVLFHNTRDKSAIKRLAALTLGVSIFATLVVGFNPYILTINKVLGRPMRILKQHHELVNTVTKQFAPEALLSRPRSAPEKLVLGLFWDPSAAVNVYNGEHFSQMLQQFHQIAVQHANLHFEPAPHDDGRMRLLSPFAFDATTMHSFLDNCPPNIGGTGPLFGPLFLLSLGVLLFELTVTIKARAATPQQRICFYFAGAIIATVLSNPLLWLSRYVPQLWLVPIIAAAACLTTTKSSTPRNALAGVILLILAADLLIMEVPFWCNNLAKTEGFRAELAAARIASQSSGKPLMLYQSEYFGGPPVGGIAERLNENQIEFEKTDQPPTKDERCFRITDQPIVLYQSSSSRM